MGDQICCAAQLKVHIKGALKGQPVLAAAIYAVKSAVGVKFSAAIETQGHFNERRRADDLALTANGESPASIRIRPSCRSAP